MIFLGFATLMFGMDTMSDAVSGLKDVPQFQQLFLMFQNPILGTLAGAVLTAIIQSSSASVGILQALAVTGSVSYGAAIPIIMGQNIGTCITAMLSGVGATKNAKRTALVHLSFNVIGTAVWLAVFALVRAVFQPALLEMSADAFGIAVSHSIFNVLCTVLLFPCSGLLEKLGCRLVPDSEEPEQVAELDERLLATPPVALMSCREMTAKMADAAAQGLRDSASLLTGFDPAIAKAVKKIEDLTDHYEDILGTYLVKLSSLSISADDNAEAAMLLKAINDFERIGDHSVNLMESAQEIHEKELSFSDAAKQELAVLLSAVSDIVELSFRAFLSNDLTAAMAVEPLEEVVDDLTDAMRSGHIQRLQQGSCSIETGFVWTDLLTSLERVGDHCSNIAGCVIDLHRHDMNTHEALRQNRKGNARFDKLYAEYSAKYHL